MSYTDRSLVRVPEHMRHTARLWVERGQPHPRLLGSFFRAVLLHDLVQSFAHADEDNATAMRSWAMWLYNDAPAPSHGSDDALEKWHQIGGLDGYLHGRTT